MVGRRAHLLVNLSLSVFTPRPSEEVDGRQGTRKTKQTKPQEAGARSKQIITIFKYTHKEDKMLPALIAGAFLVP